MSRTVSSDRHTLVPSFPLLPLERLAYSIATKRSLSREFFNGIGREQTPRSLLTHSLAGCWTVWGLCPCLAVISFTLGSDSSPAIERIPSRRSSATNELQ